jgi:hypothetical protein
MTDTEPKTRMEKKRSAKGKDDKHPYSAKHVRQREALIAKRADPPKK